MGFLKNDSILLNVEIGGDKALKVIGDLESRITDLSKSMKNNIATQKEMKRQGLENTVGYQALTDEIHEQSAELKKLTDELADARKEASLSSLPLSELTKQARDLSIQLRQMKPDDPAWDKTATKLRAVKSRVSEMNAEFRATQPVLRSLMGGLNKYVNLATASVSAALFSVGNITKVRDAFLAYDEALTDAMKTTNLTRGEVEELGEELGKLDTRTSRNDLLELARIGGKLGITGKGNILEFVRAADRDQRGPRAGSRRQYRRCDTGNRETGRHL